MQHFTTPLPLCSDWLSPKEEEEKKKQALQRVQAIACFSQRPPFGRRAVKVEHAQFLEWNITGSVTLLLQKAIYLKLWLDYAT